MAAISPVPTRYEEIIERLIRSYGPQLSKRLRRVLSDPGSVEEVMQESYERLLHWRRLEQVDGEARKAVLFAVAYRLAVDRLRRASAAERKTAAIAADHATAVFDALAPPERQVMAQQAVACLNEVIDSLPERLREPMVLRYVEELPHAAICARLGIRESNLQQRLTEARALCRERMASVGFDWLWRD